MFIVTIIAVTIILILLSILTLRLIKYINNEREKAKEIKLLLEKERQALISIYEATEGNQWKNNQKWCSNSPINEWKGVFHHNGFVYKLILPDNNLKGFLPGEAFLDLPYLIEIDLRDNGIEGPIPKEISSLYNLQGLYLYTNRFTSKVPKEIADLPNLMGIIIIIIIYYNYYYHLL